MANIWVAFGTGKNFTHYHINDIATTIGAEKSVSLPVFHSFTGCDTVSAFYGKAKASAWTAWKCFPEVTEAFCYIAKKPVYWLKDGQSPFRVARKIYSCLVWQNKPTLLRRWSSAKTFLPKRQSDNGSSAAYKSSIVWTFQTGHIPSRYMDHCRQINSASTIAWENGLDFWEWKKSLVTTLDWTWWGIKSLQPPGQMSLFESMRQCMWM